MSYGGIIEQMFRYWGKFGNVLKVLDVYLWNNCV